MKIKESKLRKIIKEERSKLAEQGLHSMSPAGKALANSIKGKFMRMYPDAKVGIDARGGFITVNGKKAVDMSQATGRGMSDDEMIEKLHAVYAQTQVDADVPTADSRMDTFREGKMKITKRQLKRIIKEEKAKLIREADPDIAALSRNIPRQAETIVEKMGPDVWMALGIPDSYASASVLRAQAPWVDAEQVFAFFDATRKGLEELIRNNSGD